MLHPSPCHPHLHPQKLRHLLSFTGKEGRLGRWFCRFRCEAGSLEDAKAHTGAHKVRAPPRHPLQDVGSLSFGDSQMPGRQNQEPTGQLFLTYRFLHPTLSNLDPTREDAQLATCVLLRLPWRLPGSGSCAQAPLGPQELEPPCSSAQGGLRGSGTAPHSKASGLCLFHKASQRSGLHRNCTSQRGCQALCQRRGLDW